MMVRLYVNLAEKKTPEVNYKELLSKNGRVTHQKVSSQEQPMCEEDDGVGGVDGAAAATAAVAAAAGGGGGGSASESDAISAGGGASDYYDSEDSFIDDADLVSCYQQH
jgi:hypothetical protein